MAALLLGGCGSDDPSTSPSSAASVPVNTAPTALRWTSFNGMSIPAAGQGPHTDDDVAPKGFDHTPPGAALAAINATIRISVAFDNQWPEVVRTNLAPGTARDAFITSRIQLSTTTPVPAGTAPRVIGWKVTDYTAQRASVDIFTQMPDQSLTVNHTTVVWTAFGDWGLLLPEAGATSSPVAAIDALPGDAVQLKGP